MFITDDTIFSYLKYKKKRGGYSCTHIFYFSLNKQNFNPFFNFQKWKHSEEKGGKKAEACALQ